MKDELRELRGLSKVRVAKKFLLDTLKKNRKEHEKAYYEILEARQAKLIDLFGSERKKVLKSFAKELNKVKEDSTHQPWVLNPNLKLPVPEDHTSDYDKTISLISASLDTEFELSNSEFNQYVNDDWSWKDVFVTASGIYLPSK